VSGDGFELVGFATRLLGPFDTMITYAAVTIKYAKNQKCKSRRLGPALGVYPPLKRPFGFRLNHVRVNRAVSHFQLELVSSICPDWWRRAGRFDGPATGDNSTGRVDWPGVRCSSRISTYRSRAAAVAIKA
jgi:hypothetical protein